MSITLNTGGGGGGSITITNPTHPYRPGKLLRQIVQRRDDGSYNVTRIGGAPIVDFELSFSNYPDADKQTLDTWIEDEALGAGVKFTYTDPDGTDYTNMRLLKGTEDWETENFDGTAYLWRGTLVLSKDLG